LEIGFPGARASVLSLSSLEPEVPEAFFQAATEESPYGLGGQLPFQKIDARGVPREKWSPLAAVDTPITALHWTRGALGLNQFTLQLLRMVGNRAYLGLQYHSDKADSQFYDYAFNVHQPYLSGWGILGQLHGPMDRDSASLVIQDTSHNISATHLRPRLGFWLGPNTVAEAFADWSKNTSSLARPTNPAQNDTTQSLYPASLSAFTSRPPVTCPAAYRTSPGWSNTPGRPIPTPSRPPLSFPD
jgi:hypothetical protein